MHHPPSTILAHVAQRARDTPERIAWAFLDRRLCQTEFWTYCQTWEAVRCRAAAVAHLGVDPGDRVLITAASRPEFITTLLAVQAIGAIPCPVGVHRLFQSLDGYLDGIRRIADQALPRIWIGPPAGGPGAALNDPANGGPLPCPTATWKEAAEGGHPLPAQFRADPDPEAIALVQRSSGTTAHPHLVALSHGALQHNTLELGRAVQAETEDRVLVWVPLYHDMGLVGGVLGPLSWGATSVIMDPMTYLARPLNWVIAMSQAGTTLTAAPTSAYLRVAREASQDRTAAIDLRHLRGAVVGAEPVWPHALELFEERFCPLGLRRGVLLPAYGLAENTLCVSLHPLGQPFAVHAFRRDPLLRQGLVIPAGAEETGGNDLIRLVACGYPLRGVELGIGPEAAARGGEPSAGEITVRGPSLMTGPMTSGQVQRANEVQTGDIGFVYRGQVHLVGRTKDLIIREGTSILPAEIEEAVGRELGAEAHGIVAVSMVPESATEEILVLVLELGREGSAGPGLLEERARNALYRQLGVRPDQVVIRRRGWVPRTSSGKPQRHRVREQLWAESALS